MGRNGEWGKDVRIEEGKISFFSFLDFTYLFLERGERREKERERNIKVWLLVTCPLLRTWLATQACSLTGNRTSNPLVCRLALNALSHTSQGGKISLLDLGQNMSRVSHEQTDNGSGENLPRKALPCNVLSCCFVEARGLPKLWSLLTKRFAQEEIHRERCQMSYLHFGPPFVLAGSSAVCTSQVSTSTLRLLGKSWSKLAFLHVRLFYRKQLLLIC